ncbi:MAG: SGNH/GDSL hydrolase family protein [Pyrinomonadaceae bacterium]
MHETETSEIPRGRRRLLKLLTLVIGIGFALVLLEVGLRVVGYSSPEFYEADETLGYRLIPGMSGWYTREGRSWVTINSDGFRDVEHTIEKPADVYRIAVIGDSYVEGLQVDREEMFTNYLGPAAASCDAAAGKNVETLTFGVSGYGTAQELLMLREKVLKYSPDLVLLMVTTNNDISDNLRAFKQTPIPYFQVGNGQLVLDDSFRSDRKFLMRDAWYSRLGTWLKNNLRFMQAIADVQRTLKYKWDDWSERRRRAAATLESPANPQPQDPNPAFEAGIDLQIYRPPSDDNWRAAWDVTEKLIAEMNTESLAHGARFAVIIGSNGVQVLPDKKQREDFAKTMGVDDLLSPNRRLASFCTASGIPVEDVVPELADYSERTGTVLHGFPGNIGYGHWNQAGHTVAGETIASHLCDLMR